MTSELLVWLQGLIDAGEARTFYRARIWRRVRREVLDEDKHECQLCKARGTYTRADTVHHVRRLEEHPELALSKTYTDGAGIAQRQLISLCHDCHDRIHEHGNKPREPLTPERW